MEVLWDWPFTRQAIQGLPTNDAARIRFGIDQIENTSVTKMTY